MCCGNRRIAAFLTRDRSLAKSISLFHCTCWALRGEKRDFYRCREMNIQEKGTGEGRKRGEIWGNLGKE